MFRNIKCKEIPLCKRITALLLMTLLLVPQFPWNASTSLAAASLQRGGTLIGTVRVHLSSLDNPAALMLTSVDGSSAAGNQTMQLAGGASFTVKRSGNVLSLIASGQTVAMGAGSFCSVSLVRPTMSRGRYQLSVRG